MEAVVIIVDTHIYLEETYVGLHVPNKPKGKSVKTVNKTPAMRHRAYIFPNQCSGFLWIDTQEWKLQGPKIVLVLIF